MTIRTVGIVGLGIMGSAFAANLLRSGFAVVGSDLDPRRMQALDDMGGRSVSSPADAAEAAEVVLTSLPSVGALQSVVHGPGGLLAAAEDRRRSVPIVETSTLPLDAKEAARAALGSAGMLLLDCPVSGTGAQAQTGDLIVLGSGDQAAFERLEPVFAGFARASRYIGAFGDGSRMKFVANLLVAVHNAAAAEAMALARKAGLDLGVVYDVIRQGAGTSRVFELRGPMMVTGSYNEATMKVTTFQKDLTLIAAFAQELGVPTFLLAATAQLYASAAAQGLGDQDTAAVMSVIDRMSGETVSAAG